MPGIRLKYTFHPCNLPVRYEETSSVLDCNSRSYEIDGAKCECAAGKSLKAICKYISVLCYALEDFSR